MVQLPMGPSGRSPVARLAPLAFLVALAIVSSATLVSPAHAEVTTTALLSVEEREVMNAQAPLLVWDEKVRQLADKQSPSPLAGTRLDAANKRLLVFWAADIPAELESLRKAAGSTGVSLTVKRAAFSEHALKDAANQLGSFAEATGTEMMTELRTDGSGLTVQLIEGAVSNDVRPSTSRRAQVDQQINAIRSRTGVPVVVKEQTLGRPSLLNRDRDVSPFSGGALTYMPITGKLCTSGFPMGKTGSSTRYMLTAAHCANWADDTEFRNNDFSGSVKMGDSDFVQELYTSRVDKYDIAAIRLDGDNHPWIWTTGPYDNDFTMSVNGYASNGMPENGTYCVNATQATPKCVLGSGAQIQVCWYHGVGGIPANICIYYISYVSKTGEVVACNGDSGGPVYYWQGNSLIAAGVVGFGWTSPCNTSGGVSVVATAINIVPGLYVRTQ